MFLMFDIWVYTKVKNLIMVCLPEKSNKKLIATTQIFFNVWSTFIFFSNS